MTTTPTEPDPIDVYRQTVEPLYAFVIRRAEGDRTLAEDTTQETYLRFIAECKRNRQPRTPLPWLQTVAHNLLMDHHRRKRPGTIDPASLDNLLSASAATTDSTTQAVLWGLARIKPHWASLIASFHLDGKSVSAIAADTGQSERAVEGQLRRARESLREALKPYAPLQEKNHD